METKEPYSLSPGSAISPVDGRYHERVKELSPIFSEMALMKFRLLVEVEYLISLSTSAKIIRWISPDEKLFLRSYYKQFNGKDFQKIKECEKETNHDVTAVTRYLSEELKKSSLRDLVGFVHFGLTSEDINNTSYALMLREGTQIMINQYQAVSGVISESLVRPHLETAMLALTHGQPASPTTVGWEMNVFYKRLESIIKKLSKFSLLVKFGGATGGQNALYKAYPNVDWRRFSELFIKRLNSLDNQEKFSMTFKHNPYTTQIEPHDTYSELFDLISRGNTILIDFCQDVWTYISREYITQKPVAGEDGSSAMPHKVNPIDFENAEGNLEIANALFELFSKKLPISRLQRHLSDCTIIRNFGTAFAHTLVSLKSLKKGLGKVYVNTKGIKAD
jgi:adenylosuccinate lyase